MTRLRRLWIALAMAALMVAGAVDALLTLRSNTLDEQVARIQPGMTIDQVQEIMGRPADRVTCFEEEGEPGEEPAMTILEWDVGRYRIHANFERRAFVSVAVTVQETRLDRLRRWLGW